jgi:hypothetical protein
MMLVPFLCHWNVSGGEPTATTVNTAVPPIVTLVLVGCVTIVGLESTRSKGRMNSRDGRQRDVSRGIIGNRIEDEDKGKQDQDYE